MSLSLKSIFALSAVFLLTAFFACNNNTVEPELLNDRSEYSSISMVDETYKIDSSIAMSNWKKEKLLAKLETENLIEKKKIEEIPDFIKAFLDGVSVNKTFDIAVTGEEWNDGAWVHGFDKKTKDIVNATAYIAKPFPTKQLIYFGVGKNMAMISYYVGGIRMVQHVMILKFEENKIVDVWFDNNSYGCDSGFGGTKKDALIKYVKKMSNGC